MYRTCDLAIVIVVVVVVVTVTVTVIVAVTINCPSFLMNKYDVSDESRVVEGNDRLGDS